MPPIFHWLRGKKIPYFPSCPSRQVCGTMRLRLARLLLQPLWGSKAFYKPLRYVSIGLPRPQKTITDFEAILEGKQAIPEYFNFASDVLDMWTQMEKTGKRPPNPAFWWINGQGDEVKWSFEELGIQSRKAANVLSRVCNLRPGDRLLVILPRIPEWWLVNVACMRTGIIIIPGISQLTMKDIQYRLQASGAKAIVTIDSLAPQVDAISADCPSLRTKVLVSGSSRQGWLNFRELCQAAPEEHNCVKTKSQDPSVIYFTSGTSGAPKMLEHTQIGYGVGFSICARKFMDLTNSDIFWNTSDTGWVKTAWSSYSTWITGACLFTHELPKTDTSLILNTLCQMPITVFCCVPTMFQMIVQQDLSRYKFKSLRHCVAGGESLNPDVRTKWKSQTGVDLYEGYGQSETTLICGNQIGKKIKPGSMGKAFPPYDVQIVDDEGNILPPGKEGNIGIRIKPKLPVCFFTGYLNNAEKTASCKRGDFYLTGDCAHMDEDGYFWFKGRMDDVINSSSYRIGPFEVESALSEHPAVAESAAVSSPDPIRGEVVKAFVVLNSNFINQDPGELTRELQDHVKKLTAPYKYPRKVEFVQELPKTVSGKIQRSILRKKEWGN
ncbi:acyl-coenzyme A synthetase ACSM5, mitochondrial isoform X1 [Monodelphis domestica]|uniref:acyl-coenzyme A synthetase ACSM5, mitochondrial isoform X1 n=2 Tax=Monodelphis domestica TaxID=13616 RepID=UPI0024E1D34C|nr:acyl-coenzyme A synthetase ACSM5, mitochondrial isoform X1 [Monodelphis domestica]